jgi:YVTN family beta-propeller protein
MKVMWKAAFAAVLLIAATSIEIGCGDTYRPVAKPVPPTTGNPAGNETEAMLSCCLNPISINAVSATPSSVLTDIDVSGDTNSGDKVLGNIVGNGKTPVGAAQNPMAFDGTRTSIFAADTASDSVTQSLLNISSGGFSASTNTIALPAGSHPIAMSFQYYGPTYTQDYVVNSGTNTAACPGTGSIGVIAQNVGVLKNTICVGPSPVAVWIFRDLSKVFVLDGNGTVDVVSASKYKVTNSFAVGKNPIKMAQSADGNYIYVLNSGDGTISIIDAVAEQVLTPVTVPKTLNNPLVDIAQDPNFTDTSANTQYNHIWTLQADGTVSVFDNSSPGTLAFVTSVPTITGAQLTAGVYPTNIALLRDGTMAYVGLGNSDQMVALSTVNSGLPTASATTSITVGVHRSASLQPYVISYTDPANPTKTITETFAMSETTTPTVNYVAVSRQGSGSTGDSADLAKAYAITTTSTTYTYFNTNGTTLDPTTIIMGTDINLHLYNWTLPSWCSQAAGSNVVSCPNLYSGTAVVAGASNGTTPVNTFITTIPAPAQVTYCNPATTLPDAAMACPLMTPTVLLGRS